MTSNLVTQWLPCQASGAIGSVLGLVGPVSVYYDWERYNDLQLPSQCGSTYNCTSRSVPEIHYHVAGTFSNQQITTVYLKTLNPSKRTSNLRTRLHTYIASHTLKSCTSLSLKFRTTSHTVQESLITVHHCTPIRQHSLHPITCLSLTSVQ